MSRVWLVARNGVVGGKGIWRTYRMIAALLVLVMMGPVIVDGWMDLMYEVR